MNNIIRKIKNSINNRLIKNTLVKDLGFKDKRAQKRVLVSYLDYNKAKKSIKSGQTHTNQQELIEIVNIFINKGYCVDVCSCNYNISTDDKVNNKYDIVFGFGKAFFNAIDLNPKAKKILYMTENPYYISYKKEKERIDYFYERTGFKENISRSGLYFRDSDELKSDIVICLGEERFINKVRKNVYRMVPTAFYNKNFVMNYDTPRPRKNFLVLGSYGFVHKGYDLLIEVFRKHKDWNLYFCGGGLPKFLLKYGIKRPSNVHYLGFIDINSNKFLELANKCSAIVQFSCSESTSTSVLTGMRHGLIPLVCYANGFDTMQEYCYYAEDYRVDDIEKTVENYISLSDEKVLKKSIEVYDYANKMFTLSHFKDTFNEILNYIESLEI